MFVSNLLDMTRLDAGIRIFGEIGLIWVRSSRQPSVGRAGHFRPETSNYAAGACAPHKG